MSSRRLTNRGRSHRDSSPAQLPSESEDAQEPTPLPPYQPPTFALTPTARRALEALRAEHDYTKYKKHLDGSVKAITNSIGDFNDRLRIHKEDAAKAANRRRQVEDNEERTEEDIEREVYINGMERRAQDYSTKAEKALRDLIDYDDELVMKDTIMKEVIENVPAAPVPRSAVRRQRRQGSSEGEDGENEEPDVEEDGDAEANGPVVSAMELLKKAQAEYAADRASKSMRDRYYTNDYRGFKKTVHVSLHGDSVPVPHPRTWFPEDNRDGAANSRSVGDDEASDEDIVIARATTNLKCILTLQTFREPYGNKKCKHVFEKETILGYLDENGTVFGQPRQSKRRQRPLEGPKAVKCPQAGCEAMLALDDFYLDEVLLRQVKQAARQAARDEEDDDDDPPPRGTQRNNPADVDEDGDPMDVEEDQRQRITRVKSERQSMAPNRPSMSEPGEDDTEAMDEK